MKMLGNKATRCPYGCCRGSAHNHISRSAEVRTMKRRERAAFKQELQKGLI